MPNLQKLKPSEIKLNTYYSAPIFFDDGKYMFLARAKMVRPYHLAALKRWNIPFLLTAGHEISEEEAKNMKAADEAQEIEEIEEISDIEEL